MNAAKWFAPLLAFSSLLVPPGLSGQARITAKPSPVEVWCGGDDGLTLGLRDATERAFKDSSDFPLATAKRRAVYKVLIPTHVGWERVGPRTKILYTIQVTRMNDKEIGTFKGSCWDSDFPMCGTQIVDSTGTLLGAIKTPK